VESQSRRQGGKERRRRVAIPVGEMETFKGSECLFNRVLRKKKRHLSIRFGGRILRGAWPVEGAFFVMKWMKLLVGI